MREALASYAHQAWSGWMRYMFGRSQRRPDGSLIVSPDLVARWERQSNTTYADLSEVEKASDREEADRISRIIAEDKVQMDRDGLTR